MPQPAPKYKLGQIVTVQSKDATGKNAVPYQGVIKTLPKIDGIIHDNHSFIYGVYSKSHGTIHPVYEAQIVKAEDPTPDKTKQNLSEVPPDFDAMTKAQILDFADENKIPGLSDTMNKKEMIAALNAAIQE